MDLYIVTFNELNLVDERRKKLRQKTWKCFEELYALAMTNAIGVSNYMIPHLEEIAQVHSMMPLVNQVIIPVWFRHTFFLTCLKKERKLFNETVVDTSFV